MNKFWHRYSPIFHLVGFVVTMAFTAGIVWASNSTDHDEIDQNKRAITNLQERQGKQAKILTRMDYNIQIIARKVGVKPLENAGDE